MDEVLGDTSSEFTYTAAYLASRSLKNLLFWVLIWQAAKSFTQVARMFETDAEHGRKDSSCKIRASCVILVVWFTATQSTDILRITNDWYKLTKRESYDSSWFCSLVFIHYLHPIHSYFLTMRYFMYMQIITVITRELASMNKRVAISQRQAIIYDQKTSVFDRNSSLNSDISFMNSSIAGDQKIPNESKEAVGLKRSKTSQMVHKKAQVQLVTAIINSKCQNNNQVSYRDVLLALNYELKGEF